MKSRAYRPITVARQSVAEKMIGYCGPRQEQSEPLGGKGCGICLPLRVSYNYVTPIFEHIAVTEDHQMLTT